MKPLLFMMTAGLLIFTTSSFASLPDEIDYPTYKRLYDQNLSSSNYARSQANDSAEDIRELENEQRQIENSLASLHSGIVEKQNKITQLLNSNTELSYEIRDLNREIERLRGSISELERMNRDLEGRKGGVQNRIRTAQMDLNNLSRDLEFVRGKVGELERASRERDASNNRLNSALQKQNDLKREISDLQSRQNSIGGEISRIEASKAQLLNLATDLQSKISDLTESLKISSQNKNALLIKSRGLQAQLKDAQAGAQTPESEAKIKELTAQLNSVMSELEAAKRETEQFSSQLETANIQLRQAQAKISSTDDSINKLVSEQAQIPSKISKKQQEISLAQNEANNLRSEISRADEKVRQLQREMANYPSVDMLNDKVRMAQMTLDNLNRDFRDLDEKIKENERIKNANSRQISDDQSTINQDTNTISNNGSQVSQLQNAISKDQNTIATENSRKDDVIRLLSNERQDFANLDASARRLEGITSNSLSEFQRRESLYNQYLSSAKALGSSQANALGANVGKNLGIQNVKTVAFNNGAYAGKQVGLLTGYLSGLVAGKNKGQTEGYSAGYNAPENHEAGFKVGYALGKEQAWQEALRDVFPLVYQQTRDEMMKEVLGQKDAELDNSFENDEGSEKSLAQASAIDNDISYTEAQIQDWARPSRSLSEASYAFQELSNVTLDMSAMNCSAVYKGVSNYIQACEAQYKSTFVASAKAAFKNEFYLSYANIFKSSYATSFEANKNLRFNEGQFNAYKVTFAEAQIQGADDANKVGVQEGTAAGFKENIQGMRAKAQNDAILKVQDFFAKNSVLRIDELKLASDLGELRQGTKINLQALVSNLGQKDSSVGRLGLSWKVASNNVSVETTQAALLPVSARTQVELGKILTANINSDAMPGSELALKVAVNFPGDDLQKPYVKEFVVRGIVTANPEISVSSSYDKSPGDWKKTGLFGWGKGRFNSSKLSLTLSGKYAYVPGEYSVDLEVLEGADLVDFSSTTQVYGKLLKGQSVTKDFSYKFKAFVTNTNNRISVKAKISYNGKIIGEELLSMTPRHTKKRR